MKKLFIPISIITFVLILSGISIFQSDAAKNNELFFVSEIIHVGFIAIFIILGIFFAIKRRKSREQGLPEEDELSKRITQKASSAAFYISLFIWLILLYIERSKTIDNSILFGYGFIAMASTFIISWSVINYGLLKDE